MTLYEAIWSNDSTTSVEKRLLASLGCDCDLIGIGMDRYGTMYILSYMLSKD